MRVKLVRDKLPGECGTRAVKQLGLLLKLHEEAEEIARAPSDPEEYADLFTVLIELSELNGISWMAIATAYSAKLKAKGGFKLGKIRIEED